MLIIQIMGKASPNWRGQKSTNSTKRGQACQEEMQTMEKLPKVAVVLSDIIDEIPSGDYAKLVEGKLRVSHNIVLHIEIVCSLWKNHQFVVVILTCN